MNKLNGKVALVTGSTQGPRRKHRAALDAQPAASFSDAFARVQAATAASTWPGPS